MIYFGTEPTGRQADTGRQAGRQVAGNRQAGRCKVTKTQRQKYHMAKQEQSNQAHGNQNELTMSEWQLADSMSAGLIRKMGTGEQLGGEGQVTGIGEKGVIEGQEGAAGW